MRGIDGHPGFGLAERMHRRLALAISLVVVASLLAWWLWRTKRVGAPTTIKEASNAAVISGDAPDPTGASNSAPTNVYAHNLMLRKGPTGFRVYVRWLRGQMARTSRNVNPSFDDPESFFIDVKKRRRSHQRRRPGKFSQ